MTTDGELVRRSLRNDRASCEELVNRWSARVLAFCHARIGNRHAAEDLAQESLLRALRGLATLEDPEKFGTWLCGIAVRVCLDWRKCKQSSQVNFTALSANGWTEDCAAKNAKTTTAEANRAEDIDEMLAAVKQLSEKHRQVLMLFYYDGMKYQDMADMLGVSSATINARLTEARATLRARLQRR